MSNSKMLIDASHPEETRVVVLKGNRVEEFDFEAANKKQLRGNIYLAKVTRVEPSLQAAFIEYGGNRHGFLAFSEIHPDYYQIPFADRQALLEEEARAHRDEEDDSRGERHDRGSRAERGGPRGERQDQGERSERGDRNHRRSRRHRRDGAVSALDRRGPADDSISEAAPLSSDHEEPVTAVGFDQDGEIGTDSAVMSSEPSLSTADEALPEDFGTAESGPYAETSQLQGVEAESPQVPQHDAAEAVLAPPLTEDEAPALDDATAFVTGADPDPAVAAGREPAPTPEAAPSQADLIMAGVAAEGGGTDTEAPVIHDEEQPAAETSLDARLPDSEDGHAAEHEDEHVEQIGGDALEDATHRPARLRRHYKIQEVIKRRQILLIQVVKEERGNKGAALTTYLSLAGRYSVLMPNTARGGGISRKITDGEDRRRLKAIAQELDVPEGMGVILRTAGAARSPIEVRRDFEYLLRMWESVRELTLKSTAPSLVYEEGSLIKRSIRDLYGKEVEDIVVAGEEGFGEARDFMRMLMPNNVKSVQLYRDPQPIFAKSGVEAQLDSMFSNHVTLKSGGYLVINQTEALVAIDVNSGRSTREHNIEDTALRTNLEAADEVARQLRLRDLAGLIVVDFIDMEEGRNNRAVERRIKEALKNDRARIQIGRISHFGLLEMSRQRIRTGVLEGSTVICPHCAGAGTIRSTASIALHVLRLLEDALIKDASHDLIVRSRSEVALYVLNQKRAKLVELEQRFGVTITVTADATLTGMIYHAIERGELATPAVPPAPRRDLVRVDSIAPIFDSEDEIEQDASIEATEADGDDPGMDEAASADAGDGNRKRRRRRRRRGRDRDGGTEFSADAPQPFDDGLAAVARIGDDLDPDAAASWDVAASTEANVAAVPDDLEPVGFTETTPREGEVNPAGDVPAEPTPDETSAAEESERTEAPRPRRTRRTAARKDADADPVDGQGPAAEATPAPRRRRASRSRAAEVTPELSLEPVPIDDKDGIRPSADRDVGADTVEHHAPLASSETAAPPPDVSVPPAPPADEIAPPAEPPTVVEDPNRPKRSGWWQRAKASFGS